MNIIEELWYGNISPCERDFKKGSKYSELLGYIVRHEEDLKKHLNDEEIEILEKFTEEVFFATTAHSLTDGLCDDIRSLRIRKHPNLHRRRILRCQL